MAEDAERDQNRVPTSLGASSLDTRETVKLAVNPATGGVIVEIV